MKLTGFIFSLLAVSATGLGSSGWGSGGGNARVCFDDSSIATSYRDVTSPKFHIIEDDDIPHITKIEILDLYLAKKIQSQSDLDLLIPMLDEENEQQYIRRLIKRMEMYFPGLSFAAMLGKDSLFSKRLAKPIKRFRDEDLDSLKHNVENSHCVIATIAGQGPEFSPDSTNSSLIIDKRLFEHEKHSLQSRAVTLLHEYVYKYVIRYGTSGAASVRELVGKFIMRSPKSVFEVWKEIEPVLKNLGDQDGYLMGYEAGLQLRQQEEIHRLRGEPPPRSLMIMAEYKKTVEAHKQLNLLYRQFEQEYLRLLHRHKSEKDDLLKKIGVDESKVLGEKFNPWVSLLRLVRGEARRKSFLSMTKKVELTPMQAKEIVHMANRFESELIGVKEKLRNARSQFIQTFLTRSDIAIFHPEVKRKIGWALRSQFNTPPSEVYYKNGGRAHGSLVGCPYIGGWDFANRSLLSRNMLK